MIEQYEVDEALDNAVDNGAKAFLLSATAQYVAEDMAQYCERFEGLEDDEALHAMIRVRQAKQRS